MAGAHGACDAEVVRWYWPHGSGRAGHRVCVTTPWARRAPAGLAAQGTLDGPGSAQGALPAPHAPHAGRVWRQSGGSRVGSGRVRTGSNTAAEQSSAHVAGPAGAARLVERRERGGYPIRATRRQHAGDE